MKIRPDDRQEIADMLRNEGFTDETKDKVLYALDIDMVDADDVDFASCLADLIDQPVTPVDVGTTEMRNRGDYMPRHKFRRMECVYCGGIHWEQPNDRLRMPYCPYCQKRVTNVLPVTDAAVGRLRVLAKDEDCIDTSPYLKAMLIEVLFGDARFIASNREIFAKLADILESKDMDDESK